MKIEEFKVGELRQCYRYSCFVPAKIDQEWTWDSSELTTALEKAIKALAGLNACSQFVPDISLFIRMHMVSEASASSRIEGTRTEIEKAVLPESAITEERRNDWREVNNYITAMQEAMNELALRVLRYLYSEPRTTVKQLETTLQCGYQPASRMIKALIAKGVLVPSSDAKRNTIYDFRRYLDIFKE